MKRRAAIGGILLALALPVVAGAGMGNKSEREYGGRIANDPGTYFGFDVQRRNGDRVLRRFLALSVPFTCTVGTGGSFRTGDPINGSLRVRDKGKIRGKVVHRQNEGSVTLRLRGKLDGNRAHGTLNITSASSSGRCYSGTFPWRARKPSVPLPDIPPRP